MAAVRPSPRAGIGSAPRRRMGCPGPGVTNPQTRHPLILANLAAGLEHLAPGRSFLGLGTGNSGVRHAGASPATLDTVAQAVETTRRLLQGGAVEMAGVPTTVKGGGVRVPILLAGSGPKMLRLAPRRSRVDQPGRHAGGDPRRCAVG